MLTRQMCRGVRKLASSSQAVRQLAQRGSSCKRLRLRSRPTCPSSTRLPSTYRPAHQSVFDVTDGSATFVSCETSSVLIARALEASVSKPDTLVRFHFVQGYAAGLYYGGRTVLHCHVSHKTTTMFSHCRTPPHGTGIQGSLFSMYAMCRSQTGNVRYFVRGSAHMSGSLM